MIQVGILGFSRREGTFAEVGIRSWEEAGCAAVESGLMIGNEHLYTLHRPLVIRITRFGVQKTLRDWCDSPNRTSRCQLILTVGAVGSSKADIVPEVTQSLAKFFIPGIPELLRRAAAEAGYPEDGVTRGLAGIRGETLIINMPGHLQGHAHGAALFAAAHALAPALPSLLADIQSRRS